ncbi:putative nuclease HARBI1 [Coccinella septempunctata]|uniref:putative nuclease HARBI1 n=1 Tax=Coccinella septempunctata TaxID=41139 RepID=UPI001D080E92|nr:putative nuclease HARBI1 [Coccinella septempunctata]
MSKYPSYLSESKYPIIAMFSTESFIKNMSVSPINHLLTCIRLYATGAHLDCIADFIGIHPTTPGRIVQKVTRSIAILYDQFIRFPDNERRKILKRQFYDIARFPHVAGAIDCTHVKIQSPGGDDAEIFRNRKGYFSINVQAICNADLKFQNVVGRWPGSAHDSTIFNSSRVAMLFENGHFDDCIILGDSGYPIKKYLLTPLQNPTSRAEHLYNEAHIIKDPKYHRAVLWYMEKTVSNPSIWL